MNFKRIGRILVCLLLICCLTFHAMIPKAEATGVGLAAPIVKAATVTCNPYIIAGAALVALGLYAGVETGAFETIANNCVDALEAAGTWIKDGAMELLRTEDADGNASYFVPGDLLTAITSMQFYSDVRDAQYYGAIATGYPYSSMGVTFTFTAPVQIYLTYSDWGNSSYSYVYSFYSSVPFSCYKNNGSTTSQSSASKTGSVYICQQQSAVFSTKPTGIPVFDYYARNSYCQQNVLPSDSSLFDSLSGLNVGYLADRDTDFIDGTSARQWSEEYTDRGLKVYGGGSGNNNNDGKWFWKLMLPLTAVDLLAMSQADAWAGETPKEFDDYDTKEELKVLDTPEVEFGFGIVFEPDSGDSGDTEDPTESTEPSVPVEFPNPGGGSSPDTGGEGDTGGNTGGQTDYTSWFERIIKGIEELPSKFESWINGCKTAIEELPSKFAEWFNTISEKLSSIWETLKTIPQTILDGFRQLLSDLFVPDAEYIPNKVEALHQKFPYLDTFQKLGTSLKDYLIGLGVSPPIIYIDLGAARNSFVWGGKQIFIDLTWYAEYKPTMDFIISGFLWLWFAFRLWQSAPGIIQGTSGMWGSPDPYIGFHSWKDPQQKLGAGDGTIYSGPASVPPDRRLGWGRGRGFTERRK